MKTNSPMKSRETNRPFREEAFQVQDEVHFEPDFDGIIGQSPVLKVMLTLERIPSPALLSRDPFRRVFLECRIFHRVSLQRDVVWFQHST